MVKDHFAVALTFDENAYQQALSRCGYYPLLTNRSGKDLSIEAMLFVFQIALQIVVLIERIARQSIHQRDRGLYGFMPNKKDYRKPRSEYLFKEFEGIVRGKIALTDEQTYVFISELNPLQRDFLENLQVPLSWYDYSFLFDTS